MSVAISRDSKMKYAPVVIASSTTYVVTAVSTKSRSAMGSISAPDFVVARCRRASQPSRKSVPEAVNNTANRKTGS